MSTQFFLVDVVEGTAPTFIASTTELQMSTARGNGVNTIATTTIASGNHRVLGTPSALALFCYRVNAVTISGSITVNFWGNEDVMATNAQFAVVISRYDNSGTFISDVVAQGNANHAKGVELGTADAVQNWSVTTPTSTSFADGDWIVIVPESDAIGTMAAGSTTFRYDGTTGGASGDTFVTFTETITAYTPPVAMPPRSTQYPQLLAH